MPWLSADAVGNPAAGQVLAQLIFPEPRSLFVTIVVMAQQSFDALLRIVQADAATIRQSMILPVNTGLWASPRLGPITLDKGERLQVVSRNAVTGGGTPEVIVETQVSFFYEP